jgi:pimeloyl-ACP methyl ester carboxylesterase
MSTNNTTKIPIVFVHGLWLHAESWNPWIEFFHENGYDAIAASWPGDAETTKATRQNADAVAGYGVTEIADYIAKQIEKLDRKPILIGHSFGGILVQNLLGRDLAAAAIAIDSAPPKGVPELPLSALKSAFPVLSNPLNFWRAVSLTEQQFRFGFTNAVSEQEAKELYAKYAMPAPGRPLFQAATATFNPNSATKVNVANATRGPLLLISGADDNTVPPVMVKSALNLYHRKSKAVTEFKEFAHRGHSLVLDSGWREIAEYSLDWLQSQQLGGRNTSDDRFLSSMENRAVRSRRGDTSEI